MKIKDKVCQVLKKEGRLLTRGELMERLSLPEREKASFGRVLKDLEGEGKIVGTDKRYTLPQNLNLHAGTIQGHKKGFAFFIPEDPKEEDIFIGMENRGGSMHGDRVLVRAFPRKKKREGEVIHILDRKNLHIVGRLELDRRASFAYLIPDNPRLSYHVFVPEKGLKGAQNQQKVVVQITHWPKKNHGPMGQVVEILGFEEEPGVDIKGVIWQLDLPQEFPKGVLEAANHVAKEPEDSHLKGRTDLRNLFTFTMDGEDAKDFDDAISLTPKDDGEWELGVHIADVSFYVTPGDEIDVEAQKRGTSIYLLDQVIPMLPESLSNNICSLKEGVDRLSFSLFMTLKGSQVLDYSLHRSVIRVKRRLTYQETNTILTKGGDGSPIHQILMSMQSISQDLRRKRMDAGSLDFNFPEVKIILDDRGTPITIERQEQGPGESIIEEFMLLANQHIAHFISTRKVPSLFRIHERPLMEKIKELNRFLNPLGYGIKTNKGLHPKALQEILVKCQGSEEERPIQNMVLRSLKQARYSAENHGHFGLAMDLYTHFTSPIRRYPDLVIHRILSLIMQDELHKEVKEMLEQLLPEVAEMASQRERLAMEAEWEVEQIKKVEYMLQKRGEVFWGVISGVIGSGFFVELPNTVEGFVRVTTLEDDYYLYNQQQMTLTGERKKKVYRLGDKVKVLVDRVHLEERQIDFMLVGEE